MPRWGCGGKWLERAVIKLVSVVDFGGWAGFRRGQWGLCLGDVDFRRHAMDWRGRCDVNGSDRKAALQVGFR